MIPTIETKKGIDLSGLSLDDLKKIIDTSILPKDLRDNADMLLWLKQEGAEPVEGTTREELSREWTVEMPLGPYAKLEQILNQEK